MLKFLFVPTGQSNKHLSNWRSAPGGQARFGLISLGKEGLIHEMLESVLVSKLANPGGQSKAHTGPLSIAEKPSAHSG